MYFDNTFNNNKLFFLCYLIKCVNIFFVVQISYCTTALLKVETNYFFHFIPIKLDQNTSALCRCVFIY